MQKMRSLLAVATLVLIATAASTPVVSAPIKLTIYADVSEKNKISPLIYGFAKSKKDRSEKVWQMNPGYFRYGGNTASRFNWKVNSWNAGKDWFYGNFSSRRDNMIDYFLKENKERSVPSSVTLPLLGWVAKDSKSSSFPTSVYPGQKHSKKGAGYGYGPDKKRLKAVPTRCCIKAGPKFLTEWVKHLKTRFGPFKHHYILGNEPMLWWETHRDVHPKPTTYDEYFAKYKAAAIAVRKADPKAVIIGPALWGWLATNYSSADDKSETNGWKKKTDRKKHGNKPFLEWFVEKIAAEEKRLGISLLDVLDVHHYAEGKKLRRGDPSSGSNRELRISATRSLWDETYNDQSWINDKVRLIPRLKEIAKRYKPSMKVAIGEYNFRGEKDIAGAIAQAETLGVFGKLGVFSANYWRIPPYKSTHFFAFKMFRNYDGKRSTFQNYRVSNSFGIKRNASVFSSMDKAKKRITVVFINKDQNDELVFNTNISKITTKPKSVKIFKYDRSDLSEISTSSVKAQSTIRVATKPLSITVLEIRR